MIDAGLQDRPVTARTRRLGRVAKILAKLVVGGFLIYLLLSRVNLGALSPALVATPAQAATNAYSSRFSQGLSSRWFSRSPSTRCDGGSSLRN